MLGLSLAVTVAIVLSRVGRNPTVYSLHSVETQFGRVLFANPEENILMGMELIQSHFPIVPPRAEPSSAEH
jgi:hypothetical protein